MKEKLYIKALLWMNGCIPREEYVNYHDIVMMKSAKH